MRYLMLLYGDHEAEQALSDAERRDIVERHFALSRRLAEQGLLVAGGALGPAGAAKVVRDGGLLVTDGPFAETKEQLGGFYLLDCRDLDEAISWAAKIPAAEVGSVEVRPVREFERSQA